MRLFSTLKITCCLLLTLLGDQSIQKTSENSSDFVEDYELHKCELDNALSS